MKGNQFAKYARVFCQALAVGVVLQALSLPIANAQAVEVHKAYISSVPNPIRFAGDEVFAIRTPAGEFTAEERTMIVERNLNNALLGAKDRSPNAVSVEIVNGLPVIRLDGKHVVTIDTVLAAVNNTTCDNLAFKWADNLRHVLSDTAKVDNYVAQMDGDFLAAPYSPPAWREQWQAARLNHAANAYRRDMPRNGFVSQQALKDEGFRLLMKRDPIGAEAFFKTALTTNGDNERARYGLGLALLKQGKPQTALMQLQMASYLEPDDAQVQMAMGEALEALGHDQDAITAYKKASELCPENPEPALYVADMREERDQIKRSSIELSHAQLECADSHYLKIRKKDQVAWRLSKPY